MAGYLSAFLRVLFWLAILAVVGLAIWLPAFAPEAVKAFIGHAALSLAAVGGVGLWVANGYAEAMRS